MPFKFKITLFALFIFLTAATGFAQTKTIEAYIVTAANDTVQGLLEQQKEKHRLRGISFKPAGESGFTSYGAAQIKAYGIKDSIQFVSKEVKVDDMQQTVFMKMLVHGPVSLYATDDLNNEDIYLVQKPGEEPHQLRKKLFLGELNLLLSECPDFKVDKKSAKKLKFTDENLSATLHAYNACRYPEQTSQRFLFKDGPLIRFGLRAGTQFSRMEYMANQGYTRGDVKDQFFLAPGVTGGAFVNIFKAHKPFALQAELLFKRYVKDYTVAEGGERVTPYTRVVNFKTNMLQLPLLLQYKLPGKLKSQPYLIAGPIFNIHFNSNFKYGIMYSSSSVANITEDISYFGGGYAVGAGIQHRLPGGNRLVLDVRYNTDYVWAYQPDPIGSPGPRKFTFSGLQVTTGITL